MKTLLFRILLAQLFAYAMISSPLLTISVEDPAKQDAPQPQSPFNPAYLDQTVVPGDDFYQYSCGGWVKRAEIPADRSRVSIFTPLREQTNKRLADLIYEAAKGGAASDQRSRRIANLFNSYMDEGAIETKGLDPLRPYLKAIGDIHDKRELARALGRTLRADVDGLNSTNFHTANIFGLWVAPGFSDPEHYTAYLMQGGLELPDRDYYLSQSAEMPEIRSKYIAHITKMLTLAGLSNADARAAGIVELESAIAQTHISLTDNNDIHKANNTWKRADFAVKAPGLDWVEYFRGAGLGQQATFIVWQPTAFKGESALVASNALDVWKDWLTFHLIEDYAVGLPKAVSDERFAFFGTILSGTPEEQPRWKRGVEMVNNYLGDDVGQLFVQRYFPPETKAQVEVMVVNLKAAFRKRIEASSWMSAATKAEAQAKLDTLYVGIGYGESWHDYSAYAVKADDLFGNMWRGNFEAYRRQVARLGSSVDRKEWVQTPQTIDSENLPLQNALTFPAAYLQPPNFAPRESTAVNYGALGSIIGHEISHTFDTEGSAFDSKGRMRNWWTADDLSHFNAATLRLAAQYSSYKPFTDLGINGRQTLTENIADLAGLAVAYDAYKASRKGDVEHPQDGLSDDQLFFLAYGQSWASKEREKFLREKLLTDTHSPNKYRAFTVRNIDEWYAAFNVQEPEKLYLAPADRIRIW